MEKIIEWAVSNASKIELAVQTHSYCDEWSLNLFDIQVSFSIAGRKTSGRAVKPTSKLAFGVAVIEGLERWLNIHHKIDEGVGFGAFTTLEGAQSSAKFELLERDAVLCHYLSNKPFSKIHMDSIQIEGLGSFFDNNASGLIWEFFAAETFAGICTTVCRAVGELNGVMSAAFGFGCSTTEIGSAEHAFLECLPNSAVLRGLIKSDNRTTELENLRKKGKNYEHIFASYSRDWVKANQALFPTISIKRKASELQPLPVIEVAEISFPKASITGSLDFVLL